ncbi:MAG: P1 family peptidase [Cyclobacteriaceae bacterium]|nr:P1 family peptidase [Cyclobacteriaceae bacterium]MCB0499257.1 P1 family peptidase [Cyclobacteriaceae bacterium]MCB9237903.1 P1 family peptidase [Flammeovirgaceae bacterium]MCO5271946.1 P1 family peptidase [Cyclobacteriaceae bacterium]MCW5902492.1 P1 family peptidase [Cyclobacteriaceae bacterium]
MINPFFEAVAQATEESIVNAMIAAETMVGIGGHTVYAIPHDRLMKVLRQYNRLK